MQEPLKTVHIEEIGSGDTVNTTSTVINDDTSSVSKELADTVEVPAATTASKSTTVKNSPITDKDTSTLIKTVSSTVKEVPSKNKDDSTTVKGESITVKDRVVLKEDTPATSTVSKPQLPPVPTSSITFLHDWKRLRAHADLKSSYFQVCINFILDIRLVEFIHKISCTCWFSHLQLLPVDKYSTILSQCLETDVFPDIINILYNSYVK